MISKRNQSRKRGRARKTYQDHEGCIRSCINFGGKLQQGMILCWKRMLIKYQMTREVNFVCERIKAPIPCITVAQKDTNFGPIF
jgi:hypothetical protein